MEVRFVEGRDRYSTDPPRGTATGLAHRLAVVQETYMPSHDGMYFDETLWNALVDFIRSRDRDGVMMAAHDRPTSSPVPIEDYLKRWPETPRDDREPPAMILLASGGRPVLCMITDYWTLVGGPFPHADNYVYGIFTGEPIFAQLRAFLASRPEAGRWNLDATPYRGEDVGMPDPFEGYPGMRLLVGVSGLTALLLGGLVTLWGFGLIHPPFEWAVHFAKQRSWVGIAALAFVLGMGVMHYAWKRR